LPNVRSGNFAHALNHSELLLVVDVPGQRVPQTHQRVDHQHPQASPGDAGWTLARV
jgi:hypothetical protein